MKRFLSIFLSVILILTLVPTFQVFAAKTPAFVISNAKGEVGDKVKVTISTENNPGIISLQVCVNYDSTALKLVDHEQGEFKGVTFGPTTKNPFITTWIDPLKPNNDTNGVIATLEFEILDTAQNGKSEISLTYDPENVFEYNTSAKDNFKNVHFDVKKGHVDIENPDAPKEPVVSSQESDVVASVDEETDNVYQQIIEDLLNDPDNIKFESNDKNSDSDSDNENIITDGAINNNNTANNSNDDQSSTNGWLIWVVVAAIVVLGGAFVLVVIKGRKSKH